MDALNKKYNIEITVLSPLSIGAGAEKDWVKGVDFVVKDSKIYLLNLNKIVQNGINPQELTTFFTNRDDAGLLKIIENKLNVVSDKIMDLPANSDNDIKSFIKNELTNKPIIPGSSLKGAMRSVILEYLLQGVKSQRLNEKDYFGESKKGDELMRFIKFSDTEFEETALVNTKIFNLRKSDNDWVGGWKHSSKNTDKKFQLTGFNTLYEAILPDEKSICSIMISDIDIFKLIEREATNELKYKIEEDKKKSKEEDLKKDTRILKIKENILSKKEKLFSINELFKIINEHTKKYINKEIVFFENYKTDKTEEIVNNLKQIKAQIFADSSVCIMKMSAGSGFHSITGDWQYDDYTNTGTWAEKDRNKTHHANAPKYKSRKIAIHNDIFSMMGFVKLRIMSDEEFYDYQVKHEQVKQQIVAEKQAEREKIKQEQERYILEQEQKTQEEVEKQRQIKEEQLKKEQAKKAEQERLDNMSPDDREKEKYKNGIQAEIGNLVNASINNGDLTSDFYKWLKHYLDNKKLWSVNINDKKNKWIKRCIAIEEKLK